jgi:hypothetical protein
MLSSEHRFRVRLRFVTSPEIPGDMVSRLRFSLTGSGSAHRTASPGRAKIIGRGFEPRQRLSVAL